MLRGKEVKKILQRIEMAFLRAKADGDGEAKIQSYRFRPVDIDNIATIGRCMGTANKSLVVRFALELVARELEVNRPERARKDQRSDDSPW